MAVFKQGTENFSASGRTASSPRDADARYLLRGFSLDIAFTAHRQTAPSATAEAPAVRALVEGPDRVRNSKVAVAVHAAAVPQFALSLMPPLVT